MHRKNQYGEKGYYHETKRKVKISRNSVLKTCELYDSEQTLHTLQTVHHFLMVFIQCTLCIWCTLHCLMILVHQVQSKCIHCI